MRGVEFITGHMVYNLAYRLILHTKDIHDVECTMINSNPKGKLTLKNLNEGRKWTVLKSMFEKYVELSEQ
jgi:hypothetical protein